MMALFTSLFGNSIVSVPLATILSDPKLRIATDLLDLLEL
jgi:hypothetical protein